MRSIIESKFEWSYLITVKITFFGKLTKAYNHVNTLLGVFPEHWKDLNQVMDLKFKMNLLSIVLMFVSLNPRMSINKLSGTPFVI